MRTKVENLIKDINGQIARVSIYPTSVITNLISIKAILKHDVDANNINKINEAISFIEQIKIEKNLLFFNQTSSMKDRLRNNRHETLTSPKFSSFQNHPISNAFYSLFAKLHQNLCTIKSEPVWTYVYAPDNEGQIMNQAIGEWQAGLMELPPTSDDANIDFSRGITIKGFIASKEKIEDLLDNLKSEADYENNEQVIAWLKANGGQNMTRFFDLVLHHGEYTPGLEGGIGHTEALEQDWLVEKGQIVFNYEAIIYVIFMDGTPFINDGQGNMDISYNETDYPLMRIKSKIVLNLTKEGKVQPEITCLQVASYSQGLTNPDDLTQKIENNII